MRWRAVSRRPVQDGDRVLTRHQPDGLPVPAATAGDAFVEGRHVQTEIGRNLRAFLTGSRRWGEMHYD